MRSPPGFVGRPVGQLSVDELRIAAGKAALLADRDEASRRARVMACPLRWTRSPWTAQRTRPARADACNPVSLLRPSRAAQYGARAVCAMPVTGTSEIPSAGEKNRETKS
jgi:hypothetical protein